MFPELYVLSLHDFHLTEYPIPVPRRDATSGSIGFGAVDLRIVVSSRSDRDLHCVGFLVLLGRSWIF